MVLIDKRRKSLGIWLLAIANSHCPNLRIMKINLKSWIIKAAILGLFFGAGFMITYLVVNGAQ